MRRLIGLGLLTALLAVAGAAVLSWGALPAEALAKPTPTPSVTASPTASPSPSHTASPSPSATVSASPGTIPAGSTRKNPLPTSPTAPALITVVPSTIDPQIENTLELYGRNLSGQTLVQIDSTAVSIIQVQDAAHLLVRVPSRALNDGDHDIFLRNPDGQFDNAVGALAARTPGLPSFIYIIGAALVGALLLRLFRTSPR